MKKSGSLLAVLCVVLLSQCTRIEAGYEGILINQYGTDKGVSDVSLVTGRVTYNPWSQDVEQFPTYVQTMDYEAFKVNAKGGSEFTVDPTISLRVIAGNSPRIYVKYRMTLEKITETTIYNHVKDAFRIQLNKYSPNELISSREQFEADVQDVLTKQLEAEGFHLEQLTTGMTYPKSITDAVNLKESTVQNAIAAENQLKTAEAQAKIKVVNAEADAKANKLKQESLTPLLRDIMFIEKWDGKTPLYGNSPTLFKNIN